MRRNGILVIGLILTVALAAGVLWATAPSDPVAEEPVVEGACHAEPVEDQTPEQPEELGFCTGGEPRCNDKPCLGPNCIEICDAGDDGVDTGWSSCCHNGNVLDCGSGTVWKVTCECKALIGGICAGSHAISYYCN